MDTTMHVHCMVIQYNKIIRIIVILLAVIIISSYGVTGLFPCTLSHYGLVKGLH